MIITIKQKLDKDFKGSSDFITQEITLKCGKKLCLCFIDSLINKPMVSDSLVEPLIKENFTETVNLDDVFNKVAIAGSEKAYGYDNILEKFLNGNLIITADWFRGDGVIVCPVQGYERRSVTEPPTSAVLKGPREGFTEDLTINLSLLRRKLKTKDFKVKEVNAGKYSGTRIAVTYISSIAKASVVKEVIKKLKSINIDGILDSFYVESLLETKHSPIFKQVGSTEKPDVAVSKLLEGRVAIVVDGSPIILTVPYVFLEDLQSGDDYYNHAMHASFIRVIRVLGIIFAITLPGIYVALQSFHYALLPIDFLISLQSAIEGLSVPPLIEILIVIFLFEILNEAGTRMPKYSGMALSIVGALVLGETAVQAGIISPPAVIIVAISGITLFTVPDQVMAVTLLRLLFTLIGGIAGFYGILVGFLFLIAYLTTFDSYGAAYFAPYAPYVKSDIKDGIFKKSLINFKTRPDSIPNKNKVRLKND